MTMIREQFQELEGVIQSIYDLEMKKKTDFIPKLYNVDSSKRASEKHMGLGSIGLMQKWNGTVHYDEMGKRWEKEYRHTKYSNGLKVERELLDDEEFKEIKKRIQKLAYSVYLTKQTFGASTFNQAADTTIVGADNKPLCAKVAAGHPLSPDNSADTQYNADALDLTPANIEKVQLRMFDWMDDRGNMLGVNPDTIIVGNYYLKKAKEILGSKNVPFEQTNTINIYDGEFKLMHNPWIKGKKWFFSDSLMQDMFLNWYNRREAKIEIENDFDDEQAKYKVISRWSWGFDEWCFLYGLFND